MRRLTVTVDQRRHDLAAAFARHTNDERGGRHGHGQDRDEEDEDLWLGIWPDSMVSQTKPWVQMLER